MIARLLTSLDRGPGRGRSRGRSRGRERERERDRPRPLSLLLSLTLPLTLPLLLTLSLLPSPALAVYQCGDQKDDCPCGGPNPFPCCDNGGNCTWWAWNAACCAWGKPPLATYGNAKDWLNEAKAAGWPTSALPVDDAVFVRTVGEYGHVGFITDLTKKQGILTTEMACWGWYGVQTGAHENGYAQGYICRKGSECAPKCTTLITQAAEVVIEDDYPCFQRFGTPSYWHEDAVGSGGHMWYTGVSGGATDNYVVWRLEFADEGSYEVFAFVPPKNASTQKARYRVHHEGQDTYAIVDQKPLYSVFTSLGTYWFAAGTGQYVRLDDATGEAQGTAKVAFDAIKVVPKPTCTRAEYTTCKDGDVWAVDTCGKPLDLVTACDDELPCTDDGCAEGACVFVPNGNPCADACEDVDCTGYADACNDAVCEGGACLRIPKAGACDDGDACTAGDACADGTCVPGAAVTCDDGSPCTADACSPKDGCVFAEIPGCCLADGDCDDGNACTVDVCVASACVSAPQDTHAGRLCKDGASWFVDSCGDVADKDHDCGACGCTEGACVAGDCAGRACGDDGCGGSCGVCGKEALCEEVDGGGSVCVPIAPPGGDEGGTTTPDVPAPPDDVATATDPGPSLDPGPVPDPDPEPVPDPEPDAGAPAEPDPDAGTVPDVPPSTKPSAGSGCAAGPFGGALPSLASLAVLLVPAFHRRRRA